MADYNAAVASSVRQQLPMLQLTLKSIVRYSRLNVVRCTMWHFCKREADLTHNTERDRQWSTSGPLTCSKSVGSGRHRMSAAFQLVAGEKVGAIIAAKGIRLQDLQQVFGAIVPVHDRLDCTNVRRVNIERRARHAGNALNIDDCAVGQVENLGVLVSVDEAETSNLAWRRWRANNGKGRSKCLASFTLTSVARVRHGRYSVDTASQLVARKEIGPIVATKSVRSNTVGTVLGAVVREDGRANRVVERGINVKGRLGHSRDTGQVYHGTVDKIENLGILVRIVELQCSNRTLERQLASELRSGRLQCEETKFHKFRWHSCHAQRWKVPSFTYSVDCRCHETKQRDC
jgi:hypothetical protein